MNINNRLVKSVSVAAFVYLTATIVVMASERVYWYWAGFDAESVFLLGAFYLIPTAAALWAMALTAASRIHQVVLGGSVFAFVVEGVLTPVIYADGPFPVLAFMFMGWHGLLAVVGFWYWARRWLIQRKTMLAGAASAVVGVMWGAWALTSARVDVPGPEEIADLGFEATVLGPQGFTAYALAVGATLAAAHWLIGFVWPRSWRPGRASTWLVGVCAAAYMAVAVLPSVVWAPVKLAALIGTSGWLLRRSRGVSLGEPTIFERLAGNVRLRDALSLMAMPLAAAATYAVFWSVELGSDVLGLVYWALVIAQVLAGAVAFTWAAMRSVRSDGDGAPSDRVPIAGGDRVPSL